MANQYSPQSNLPLNTQQPTLSQQPQQSNLPNQQPYERGIQYLPNQNIQQFPSQQPILNQPLLGATQFPQYGISQPYGLQQNLIQPQTTVQQPTLIGQQQIGQQFGQSQISQTTEQGQVIKGQSRIEYIPYERTVTEYEEVRRQVQVPITKQVTDYYAVQYEVEYIPQVIQEKQIEYVPVERVAERTEYYTVEKQNVVQQPIGYQGQIVQQQYTQPIVSQQYQQREVYQQPTVQYQQREVIQQPTVQYQQREVIQQPVVTQQYQQTIQQPVVTQQYQQREVISQPIQYQQQAYGQYTQQTIQQPTIQQTITQPQQYREVTTQSVQPTVPVSQQQQYLAQTVPLNYGQSIQQQPTTGLATPQQTGLINQQIATPQQPPTQSIYGQQSYPGQQTAPQNVNTSIPQGFPGQQQSVAPKPLSQTVAPTQYGQLPPQQDMGRTRPYQQPTTQSVQQPQGSAQKPNKEKSFLEKLFD